MHEVLGARPSMDPPVVVASYGPDADPTTIVAEIVKPTICATEPSPSTSGTSSEAPCTSASPMATPSSPSPPTPSPKKKKRKTNPIVDFLMAESEKEQKRHEESEAKTERFLNLFERLVDKIPDN
ncbi:uncharacterized protein LOC144463609 [Epinephelus lanceolatus]